MEVEIRGQPGGGFFMGVSFCRTVALLVVILPLFSAQVLAFGAFTLATPRARYRRNSMIRVTGIALTLIATLGAETLVGATADAATSQPEWITESNRQAEPLLQEN